MLSLLLCLSAALQLERKNGSARSAVFHSTTSDISKKYARGSLSELARLVDLAGLRGTVEAAFALQLRGGSAELESQVELAESWMRQGDFDAAVSQFREALEVARVETAGEEQSTVLDSILYNLGVALEEQAEQAGLAPPEEAIAAYREAAQHGFSNAVFNLATALSKVDTDEALEEALGWYSMICQYDPSNDKGWIGVGTLCKRSGRASTAAWAFSNAAKASPERHEIWLQIGDLFAKGVAKYPWEAKTGGGGGGASEAGEDDGAPDLLRARAATLHALALAPGNGVVEHMLAQYDAAILEADGQGVLADAPCGDDEARWWDEHKASAPEATEDVLSALRGAASSPSRANPQYVADQFDAFADTFDAKLQQDLQYKVPELAKGTLMTLRPEQAFKRVLDLGCGTGLNGPLYSDDADVLVGIDLSPKIVEKARDRGYTKLLVGDLDALLPLGGLGGGDSLGDETFDLILSTDTHVYFGDLGPAFKQIAARMDPEASSLAVVTLELLPEEEATAADVANGWRLTSTGRYTHTAAHVEAAAAAAGLAIEHRNLDYSPRLEKEVPVKGQLAVLRLAA